MTIHINSEHSQYPFHFSEIPCDIHLIGCVAASFGLSHFFLESMAKLEEPFYPNNFIISPNEAIAGKSCFFEESHCELKFLATPMKATASREAVTLERIYYIIRSRRVGLLLFIRLDSPVSGSRSGSFVIDQSVLGHSPGRLPFGSG